MIQVSTTPFKNDSNFDPQETFADPEADVSFQSADKDAVIFTTWVDNQLKIVFDDQNPDCTVEAKVDGTTKKLAKEIGAGTIITLKVGSSSPQNQVMAGTNGKINVGTGSGDGIQ